MDQVRGNFSAKHIEIRQSKKVHSERCVVNGKISLDYKRLGPATFRPGTVSERYVDKLF